MPTVPLPLIQRRPSRHRLAHAVSSGLLPLVVFSMTGVMIDGLAVLGAYYGKAFGLLLIVAAPALAAAAALRVARLPGLPANLHR